MRLIVLRSCPIPLTLTPIRSSVDSPIESFSNLRHSSTPNVNMKLSSTFVVLGMLQAVLAQSLAASPTESVGCEPHGDHW